MKWNIFACMAALWAGLAGAETLRTTAQDNAFAKYAVGDRLRPGVCREVADDVTLLDPSLKFRGLDNRTPLTRIEKLLESGGIDVFFCILRTRDRQERYNFIDIPLYSIRHVMLVKAEDPVNVKSFQDLLTLGDKGIVLVNFGSALIQTLDDAGVKYIAAAKSDNQLIQMLNSGRGRFIYGQDLTLIEMLRRMGLKDRYRFLPVVFKEESHYLAYTKNLAPHSVNRLEKALRSLSQSGRLDSIVSRYR